MLASQGHGSPYWLTFNQAKQLRAHVRQGEKSTLVSFWKFGEYSAEDRDTGELDVPPQLELERAFFR
jgi:antirestriction protein ArdC